MNNMFDFDLLKRVRLPISPRLGFWGKAFLGYSLHKVWETDMIFDLDFWSSDININMNHLLIKDYLYLKLGGITMLHVKTEHVLYVTQT